MHKFNKFAHLFLMLVEPAGEGGAGASGEPNPTGGNENKGPEFPADTAVKDMTPEQQTAYWKHHAQKHENRVKAYGGLTPEQARKNAEDLEEARKSKLPESERALEEAREAGRKEALTAAAKREADTALKVALRGRVIDGAAAFDRPEFVKDGSADTEALLAWVEENSQPAEGGKKPPVRIGAGAHEKLYVSGRETGKAEAEKRFGKKS